MSSDSVGARHPSRSASLSVDEDSPVPALGARDRPSFTFVEHKDNLQTKRIKDANARKAIRSHVMRDVRRRERLAGTKRPTKKGEKLDSSLNASAQSAHSPRDNDLGKDSSSSNIIHEHLPLRVGSPHSSSGRSSIGNSTFPQWDSDTTQHGNLVRQSDQEGVASPPLSTVSLDFLDPFSTLPGDPPKRVGHLMHHCATVLIPMTFPVEKKNPLQGKLRISTVVQAAISQESVFYAYMTLSSAHLAMMSGDLIVPEKSIDRRISPPDYFFVKARAIVLLNEMMQDPQQAISDSAFEAVSMLLGISAMVGNFDEGRMHAKGLLKMAQLRGGVDLSTFSENPRAMGAILRADVKNACGTLAKPIFPIPWLVQPFPPSVLDRISPLPASRLHHLASSFTQIPVLCPTIVELLISLRNLAYFDDRTARNPEVLSAADYDLFRIKEHEIEHRLISYPHDAAASKRPPKQVSELFHPLEMITRTAALLYICNNITISLPSSGIARSLILRCKRQFQELQIEERSQPPPPAALDLLTWCLFLGVQSSRGQVERPWFVAELAELVRVRQWNTWEKAEAVMERFLYVERVSGAHWRGIWEEIQHVTGVDEYGDG